MASMQQKSINYYTSEEVEQHNKPRDLWVIMNRKVYDVSKFFEHHPGGPGVLLYYGGKDATAPAAAAHKTILPSNIMKEFEIGYVKMSKDDGKSKKKSLAEEKDAKTIPVIEIPKPTGKMQVPMREKAKGTTTSSRKEQSEYDYGVRTMDGCPSSGNENGMLRDLRSVNKLKERAAEEDAKQAIQKEKADQEAKEKERVELNQITAQVMRMAATPEAKAAAAAQEARRREEKAKRKAEQSAMEQNLKEEEERNAASKAELEASAAEQRAQRLKKIQDEEAAQERAERERVVLEKLSRLDRQKADKEAWEKAKGDRKNGTSSPVKTTSMAPLSAKAPAPKSSTPKASASTPHVAAPAPKASNTPAPDASANTNKAHEKKALPPGYKIGDLVFYTGEPQVVASGEALEYGARGNVVGPGPDIRRVEVKFDRHEAGTVIMLSWLSQDIALAGGFRVGDRVYWLGGKQRFASGNTLAFGLQGVVMGKGPTEKRLMVKFDGNETGMDVGIAQINRELLPIPGGYELGDPVFYCAESESFTNGDQLTFGLQGEVQGRACVGDASDEKRIKILFQSHKASISVLVSQITPDYPKIPGGFKVTDTVYYVGRKNQTFQNGDKLTIGNKGTVVARSSLGDGSDDKRARVRFQGNKGPINVFAAEISLNPPGADHTNGYPDAY